jgi:hypothetical protein
MTAIIDGTNGVTTPNVLTSSSGVALTLQSNGGTTALTIATNQAITVANTGNGITYSSSAGSGLRMYGSAGTNQWDVYGNGANIRFSDNTGGGIVVVDTAARIGSTIGVGGTTPSSSGAGITFPATQSASSDANTLDDYEEGTWTPSVTSGTGSITSYTSNGQYIKIGQLVYLHLSFTITSAGTAGGIASITNIPFTSTGTNTNPFQIIGIVRETGQTGVMYAYYQNGGGTSGVMHNLTTNGAIAWANNYTYVTNYTYQASA